MFASLVAQSDPSLANSRTQTKCPTINLQQVPGDTQPLSRSARSLEESSLIPSSWLVLPPQVFLAQTHPAVPRTKSLQSERVSCMYGLLLPRGCYQTHTAKPLHVHQAVAAKTVSSLQLHKQKLFKCRKERNWYRRKTRCYRALFPATGLCKDTRTRQHLLTNMYFCLY